MATFRDIAYSKNDTPGSTDLVLTVPDVEDGDTMFLFAQGDLGMSGNPAWTTPLTGWTLINNNNGRDWSFWYRIASSEPATYTVVANADTFDQAIGAIATFSDWGDRGLDSASSVTDNAFDTYTNGLWLVETADHWDSVEPLGELADLIGRNCPYIYFLVGQRNDTTDPSVALVPGFVDVLGTPLVSDNGSASILLAAYGYTPTHWNIDVPEAYFAVANGDNIAHLVRNSETNEPPLLLEPTPPGLIFTSAPKKKLRMKVTHLPYDLTRTMTRP